MKRTLGLREVALVAALLCGENCAPSIVGKQVGTQELKTQREKEF